MKHDHPDSPYAKIAQTPHGHAFPSNDPSGETLPSPLSICVSIPLAANQAALGGFSSLLPCFHCLWYVYIWTEVSALAHSIVCSLCLSSVKGGIINGGDVSPNQRLEELNKIHHALVQEVKGAISSLRGTLIVPIARRLQNVHTTPGVRSEGFLRMFGVGEGWEEV